MLLQRNVLSRGREAKAGLGRLYFPDLMPPEARSVVVVSQFPGTARETASDGAVGAREIRALRLAAGERADGSGGCAGCEYCSATAAEIARQQKRLNSEKERRFFIFFWDGALFGCCAGFSFDAFNADELFLS
jgi:hypothetical protein